MWDGLAAWGQNPDFNCNNLTNIPILIDKVEPISQF
jgi:hypothetical protein